MSTAHNPADDPQNDPANTPQDGAAAPAGVVQPTLVTVVVDRSGSMAHLAGAVVEGVNQLIAGLQPADRVTIAQFDTEAPFEVLVDGIPAAEVTPWLYGQYQPRGGTPLYDAVGTGIARTAGRAQETEILAGVRPNVVLAIITDGYENSSSEYSGPQVARLIAHHRGQGWTVTYVGIGMGDEAFAEGARMGIDRQHTYSVAPDVQGTRLAFNSVLETTNYSRTHHEADES